MHIDWNHRINKCIFSTILTGFIESTSVYVYVVSGFSTTSHSWQNEHKLVDASSIQTWNGTDSSICLMSKMVGKSDVNPDLTWAWMIAFKINLCVAFVWSCQVNRHIVCWCTSTQNITVLSWCTSTQNITVLLCLRDSCIALSIEYWGTSWSCYSSALQNDEPCFLSNRCIWWCWINIQNIGRFLCSKEKIQLCDLTEEKP